MDNHRLSFSEARRRVASQRGTSFSFGALVMLGTMIPIVNLIIMPAAVCGGTLMWVERLKEGGNKRA
jgi:CysZ protein